MPINPTTGRRERNDTKTLVRLGTDARESGPVPLPKSKEGSAEAELEGGRRPNVHLWFEGLRAPVRACAELSETALLLDAPLPFLELESVVACVTIDGSSLVHGRIRSVALDAEGEQGVPRLRVAVELEDGLGADEGDELYEGLPEATEAAEVAEDPEAPEGWNEPSRAPATHGLSPALASNVRSRRLPQLTTLLVGLALGAGTTYGWAHARARTAPPQVASVSPSKARAARAEAAAPQIVPPSIVIALAAANADELARSPAAQWLATSETLAAFGVTAPWRLDEDLEAALDEADPTPPPEVALEAEAAAADGQGHHGFLQVTAADTQTRVFVPMSGTADGMRQYALTTPGIAITLPHAVVLAPLENYAVGRGLVRRVWLRRDRDGVQVRVITKRAASRVSTSFDPDGLTVVLDM